MTVDFAWIWMQPKKSRIEMASDMSRKMSQFDRVPSKKPKETQN